jgi:hypothetical protein
MQLDLFHIPEAPLDYSKGVQTCKQCGKDKAWDAFPKHKNNTSGYDTRCKACKSKTQRWVKEARIQYAHLNRGVCDCCGKKQEHKSLALDHCHDTLTFRGWLCEGCNLGIGRLGDNLESVLLAVDYLQRQGKHGLRERSQ